MKAVTFDSEADEEFRAAAAYYEGQQAGLGDDFADEVAQAVQRIAQLRKCLLRRFPYSIFFLELPDRIWIAAVAHQRRRPGYWSHRQP